MSAKKIVRAFYDSDLANDESVVSKFFHEDCEMHWTSSHGFMLLKYNDIVEFFEGTRAAYTNLRFVFTHFIGADKMVTNRHNLFANTIENPDNEVLLAHFTSIWEVKDQKLFRCYEMSQLADNSENSMDSYSEIKK